jgi:branched-chain amino acid transport system substrate-binding protein
MSTVALKTAAKTGYPRDVLLGGLVGGLGGRRHSGADAAKGYVSASFTASGTNFCHAGHAKNKVHAAGKGN